MISPGLCGLGCLPRPPRPCLTGAMYTAAATAKGAWIAVQQRRQKAEDTSKAAESSLLAIDGVGTVGIAAALGAHAWVG